MSHSSENAHAEHPSFLQHHFYTPEQQASASKLGMWLFLGQELLFFSGLFMAYIAMRYIYPETFLAAHEHLNVTMGSINTVVLLTSSLTMALGVRAAQTSNMRLLKFHMLVTIGCALLFLVIKYFEYSHKIHAGFLPGQYYSGTGIPGNPGVFFSIYFVLTGMHGLHVIIGVGVLIWIYMGARQNKFSAEYYSPVENVGLYWHLVDLIWIFLFPLLYLVK